MTKRTILHNLRRHGPMYISELGGNEKKVYALFSNGLVSANRCSDKRYLYAITAKGEAWLDRPRGLLAGVRLAMELPMKVWRRFK